MPSKDLTTYRPAGRLVLRKIGDEHLLVPVSGRLAQETYVFPLNPAGAFIWESLASGCNVVETAGKLTQSFQVDEQQAVGDCAEFVQRLVAEDLLEVVA
jgi:hypothetical protein